MPGSTSASWAVYRSRLVSVFRGVDSSVLIAFWLFGLINNVLYVIILSAAQDLVGTNVPKGVVLLADVLPSFLTKLVAPYFIHRIPYYARILIFVALSSSGMLLVALTPAERGVAARLPGRWGSGTGGAGLAGAGLYVAMTQWFGLTVKTSLLASALLPGVMVVSFFVILPRAPLKEGQAAGVKAYSALPDRDLEDEDVEGMSAGDASASLLAPGPPGVASTALHAVDAEGGGHGAAAARGAAAKPTLARNLHRAKSLFIPYMLPLLLVYVAEYTINQGVSPTLLFPLEQSPFTEFRSFYPFYGFLYQLGVFVSRSSTPFYRVHNLYLPSLLQVANLVLLTLHAVLDFIPSVYLVFAVVFWEGLLGGAVYVNTFAEIMENVPAADREFSLGATSVSDSGGICLASLIGMVLEVSLCDYQVRNGRDWCRRIEAS
uniref:Protein BTN n=1 Tax=Pyricularia oryzae (strain P131) TaxID=1143193 RepID=L7JJZ4_PYRO1